jgi:hypothetical protein
MVENKSGGKGPDNLDTNPGIQEEDTKHEGALNRKTQAIKDDPGKTPSDSINTSASGEGPMVAHPEFTVADARGGLVASEFTDTADLPVQEDPTDPNASAPDHGPTEEELDTIPPLTEKDKVKAAEKIADIVLEMLAGADQSTDTDITGRIYNLVNQKGFDTNTFTKKITVLNTILKRLSHLPGVSANESTFVANRMVNMAIKEGKIDDAVNEYHALLKNQEQVTSKPSPPKRASTLAKADPLNQTIRGDKDEEIISPRPRLIPGEVDVRPVSSADRERIKSGVKKHDPSMAITPPPDETRVPRQVDVSRLGTSAENPDLTIVDRKLPSGMELPKPKPKIEKKLKFRLGWPPWTRE